MDELNGVGRRIKALREILEIPVDVICEKTGVTQEEYDAIEGGRRDFSASFLIKLADIFGVDTTDLLTGKSPTLSTYALTRAGKGLKIERRKSFEYDALAFNFKNKAVEPLLVIAPYIEAEQTSPIVLSRHDGQEFDYILEGQLKIQINNNVEILEQGDSVLYNSANPHGMIAVGGQPCKFLAIVIKG